MFFRALIEISGLEAVGTESNHFQFADLIKGLIVVWWIGGGILVSTYSHSGSVKLSQVNL